MYGRANRGILKHLDFVLLDMLSLQIAYILAFMARHGIDNLFEIRIYRNMAFVLMVVDVAVIALFETMKNVLKRGHYQEFVMTVKHIAIVEGIVVLYMFVTQDAGEYSRLTFVYLPCIYFLVSYFIREGWKRILEKYLQGKETRSLLLVTTQSEVAETLKSVDGNRYEPFRVAGIAIMDEDMTGQIIEGVRVVAGKADVAEYVCREWIDEVLIALPKQAGYPEALINQFSIMGVVVHYKLTDIKGAMTQKELVERIGDYTVLTNSINVVSGKQIFLKRTMDILGGIVGCMITIVLFPILAVLIYQASPGPILFSQKRIGKNGKIFKIYKFRSMYLDAEERKEELLSENIYADGGMFKLEWDPRIIGNKVLPDGSKRTGIGAFIRRTSLDEFPQFFNVLKGDMSLVGTRPPTLAEWGNYELHHRARMASKPGITGLWQISGRSDIADFEEVIRMDLEYLSKWNVGLDIKILLKTVKAVLRQDGAV